MLKSSLFDVYTKFKLQFCKEIFQHFQTREASLTTVETFCMETIMALGSPTVNEFAAYSELSPETIAKVYKRWVEQGKLVRYLLIFVEDLV